MYGAAFSIGTFLGGADLWGAKVPVTMIEYFEENWRTMEWSRPYYMPTGKKYEDWLKSKGHGGDGENGGPS
jgi:hypothetical protein